MPQSGTADVAVIILTFNESANLPQAVESIRGWAREIFVVDSFSEDDTKSIAEGLGCAVVQRKFSGYADQRNFALASLAISAEWVLFLDADEWLTGELKEEIGRMAAASPKENGWYIKRRFIWMGRWIRRGYYPTWILRLFRRGTARCEDRSVNEHLIVDGLTGRLTRDFVHEDRKGISDWIAKHCKYARLEAEELARRDQRQRQDEISVSFWADQASRKRWLRYRIWNRLPPLFRPFLYFFMRYFLTGAFIEGRAALVFHFMHALWYPFLIDAIYLERKISGMRR